MWHVYVPNHNETLEADNITMDFRINAISHARILFQECLTLREWSWLRSLFTIGDPIQIKNDDQIYFNGYIQNVETHKTQKGYRLGVVLYDPLGKLVKMQYRGGFSGRFRDLVKYEICRYIGIQNRMKSDAIINIRYNQEMTRLALLYDACALARFQTDVTKFGFYYNHQLNALCDLTDEETHTLLHSLSNTNRIAINQAYSYPIANVIQVTNTRG